MFVVSFLDMFYIREPILTSFLSGMMLRQDYGEYSWTTITILVGVVTASSTTTGIPGIGANYSASVAIGATRFRPRRDPGGESACVELADILLRWFPTGIVRSETTRRNRSHGNADFYMY